MSEAGSTENIQETRTSNSVWTIKPDIADFAISDIENQLSTRSICREKPSVSGIERGLPC
jgi:hypothetical protein